MISTQVNRVVYTGDGVSTNFSFNGTVLAATDLVVVEETISTGALVTKSLGSDYTISGTQDAVGRYTAGVFVVAAIAPSALVHWIIYQNPTITQNVDLVDNGLLPVESQVELPLDRLTVIAQRLSSRISRALAQPDGDATDIAALPIKVSRASKFLGFDANGDPIAAAGTSANLTPVSSFINTLLDDANAATARATLGVSRDGLLIAPPMPAIRGLRGNRTVAFATSYSLTGANYVVLTNSAGDSVLRIGVASLTVDATAAGPVANGRDQAGAFSNTWVNIYYIWNGTTLSLIASTTNPPSGPVLPSGYTHFAYACSIYYSTSFADSHILGARVYTNDAAFTALTSTSITSIGSLATIVAPLATHVFGWARMSGTSTAGGALDVTCSVFARNTSPNHEAVSARCFQSGINSTSQISGDFEFQCPLFTAQTVYYQITNSAGTSPTASIRIKGYIVPNGDIT